MTVLRSIITLRRPDRNGRTSPSRYHYCRGHTNINAFPFRTSRLRMSLGPANPRLMIIAEEPWPLRWSGFSPLYVLLFPRFSYVHGPRDFTTSLLPEHIALPHLLSEVQRIGVQFESRPFSRPASLTSDLLRTLSRMVASKPTFWLSSTTDTVCH